MTPQTDTESRESKKQQTAPGAPEPFSVSSHHVGRHPVLQLQSLLGNRRVTQLIKTGQLTPEAKFVGLQRKLTISSPDDKYEQEAERVANQVPRAVLLPEDRAQELQSRVLDISANPAKGNEHWPTGSPAHSNGEAQRREPDKKQKEDDEADPIQRRLMAASEAGPDAGNDLETRIRQSKGGGSPLPDSVRTYMEPRFGQNFSGVRVHTAGDALNMNREIRAQAFTHGSDIYFGEGHSPTEHALTAHELTHVVQQSGGGRINEQPVSAHASGGTVLSRFPNAVTFGTYTPGLAIIPPIVKEGYDGSAHTAIKFNWGYSSWKRRWRIYDAEDNLLYDSTYIIPKPNLDISQEVVAKGKAGGKDKPWSVWHEVIETEVPFGGDDPDNFPYAYMKFNVYETWKDLMADPNAEPPTGKQAGKPGEEPAKPSPAQSSTVKNAGSVVDYGSVVAMHEAYLREIYEKAASGITATAEELVSKGVPQTEVAKWATEARNALKVKVRSDGNPILEKVFESRNLATYKNKVGPTYEYLVEKYSKQGLSPEEIDAKIIKGAGKSNVEVNEWSGHLRVAGKILLFIDIAFAGVRVYLAPEGQKVKVALEEVARIGGALAGGAAGAEGGAAAGAAIGAAFAGVGAVPGAIIGGVIGGIAGALFGGWLGQSIADKLYEMLPPSDCVFEGDYREETR